MLGAAFWPEQDHIPFSPEDEIPHFKNKLHFLHLCKSYNSLIIYMVFILYFNTNYTTTFAYSCGFGEHNQDQQIKIIGRHIFSQ